MRNPTAVAKIRKLLALAESSNAHEAESARQSAEELMLKHGLTPYDVEEDVLVVLDSERDVFKETLAHALAVKNCCSAIVSKRGNLALRGRRMDAEPLKAIYKRLVRDGATGAVMPPSGYPPPAAREAWRICWWLGYTGAIVDRLLGRPKARRGATPAREDLPGPVTEALEAFEALAVEIEGAVEDIAQVVERLRQTAHARGQDAGHAAQLGDDAPRQLR